MCNQYTRAINFYKTLLYVYNSSRKYLVRFYKARYYRDDLQNSNALLSFSLIKLQHFYIIPFCLERNFGLVYFLSVNPLTMCSVRYRVIVLYSIC